MGERSAIEVVQQRSEEVSRPHAAEVSRPHTEEVSRPHTEEVSRPHATKVNRPHPVEVSRPRPVELSSSYRAQLVQFRSARQDLTMYDLQLRKVITSSSELRFGCSWTLWKNH